MNLLQLRASKKLWQTREKYRLGQWRAYYANKKLPAAAQLSERAKWYKLYQEARAEVRDRQAQIKRKEKTERITTISLRGVSLIKHFEGFSSTIYRDSVGVPTVGYGHTENVHPGAIWVKGQKTPGRLTEAEATRLLQQDLDLHYAPYVAALKLPLSQNQFDALVSFVYNVGPGGISVGTHVGQALRAHNWSAAANALLEWDKAGGQVLAGLKTRREAERTLFLS